MVVSAQPIMNPLWAAPEMAPPHQKALEHRPSTSKVYAKLVENLLGPLSFPAHLPMLERLAQPNSLGALMASCIMMPLVPCLVASLYNQCSAHHDPPYGRPLRIAQPQPLTLD